MHVEQIFSQVTVFSVWVCPVSKLCLDYRLRPDVLNFSPHSPISVITVQNLLQHKRVSAAPTVWLIVL